MSEPQDPFKQNEVEAKMVFDLMQTYVKAGFYRKEAFAIVKALVEAGAQSGARQ